MSSVPLTPKLIFAGLDTAGKTTIYKYTIAEMNLEDSLDSKATRGIERNVHQFLDMDISIWDLGGQKSYRETYLSKPEIFNVTKAVIFVVDIQDPDRLQEAYKYFLEIMNIIMNVSPRPKVYVLFHKFDPSEANRLKKIFYQATKLFRQADKVTGGKFVGFATSIYSDTIQKAVKRILWENMEGYDPSKIKMSPPLAEPGKTPKTPTTPKLKIPSQPKPTSPVPTATGATVPKIKPRGKKGSSTPSPTGTPSVPVPRSSTSLKEFKEGIDKEFETNLTGEMDKLLSTIEETSAKIEERSAPSVAPATPAPPTRKEESVAKESVVSPPPVTEEKELEESVIYEEVPDLSDLSTHVVDKLSSQVSKRMMETPEIIAIAVLGVDGSSPLAVAKNEIQKEKIKVVGSVVSQLNPKQFFKDLGDIEYRGLGHLQIEELEIYFARLTDDYAIAILANDVSAPMLENAQRIVTMLRQGLGMVKPDEKKEEDESSEVDLLKDLRSRLSRIGSLSSLDN